MLDFSLQDLMEIQGKDELRERIRQLTEADHSTYEELQFHKNDSDYYETALILLERVFKSLQKVGVKYNVKTIAVTDTEDEDDYIFDDGTNPFDEPAIDLEELWDEAQDRIEEKRAIEGPTKW